MMFPQDHLLLWLQLIMVSFSFPVSSLAPSFWVLHFFCDRHLHIWRLLSSLLLTFSFFQDIISQFFQTLLIGHDLQFQVPQSHRTVYTFSFVLFFKSTPKVFGQTFCLSMKLNNDNYFFTVALHIAIWSLFVVLGLQELVLLSDYIQFQRKYFICANSKMSSHPTCWVSESKIFLNTAVSLNHYFLFCLCRNQAMISKLWRK